MEFVLFERSFILLPILEILSSFSIKHSIMPRPLIFNMPSISMQNSKSTLHSITKLSFVPTSICPPEGAPTISFSFHKLPFVQIRLFPCPLVKSSPVLFIEFELSNIIIPTGKIQLSHTF